MEFVIFSAQGPVKPLRPVNQPSNGKTSQSVHQRLTPVTSEQQTAEKSQGEPEVFQNGAQKKLLEVSPHLKEEKYIVDIKQVQVCWWVMKEKKQFHVTTPGQPSFTSLFKCHNSWRRSSARESLRTELLELSVRS